MWLKQTIPSNKPKITQQLIQIANLKSQPERKGARKKSSNSFHFLFCLSPHHFSAPKYIWLYCPQLGTPLEFGLPPIGLLLFRRLKGFGRIFGFQFGPSRHFKVESRCRLLVILSNFSNKSFFFGWIWTTHPLEICQIAQLNFVFQIRKKNKFQRFEPNLDRQQHSISIWPFSWTVQT